MLKTNAGQIQVKVKWRECSVLVSEERGINMQENSQFLPLPGLNH